MQSWFCCECSLVTNTTTTMMKGKKNFNDGGEGLLWAMFSHDNGACDD
jgi:hypothetical protein